MKTLLVTTGDSDGIGVEVTFKALNKIRLNRDLRIVVFLNLKKSKRFLSILNSKIKVVTISNLNQIDSYTHKQNYIYFVDKKGSPAMWVKSAAELCLHNRALGLVTGPLSKKTISTSGIKGLGHTEILKSVAGTKEAYMTFVGKYFNVMSVTGHLPIKNISKSLTKKRIISAVKIWSDFQSKLGVKENPIAILGLNPHASDNGLIGNEELKIVRPAIRALISKKINIVGPLVPDVAFLKDNYKKYSCFISMYHDQALIPFKLVHGFSGVHITLGIPFIRTSVDHGTAKDIFGKNVANCTSMLDAINLGINLIRSK